VPEAQVRAWDPANDFRSRNRTGRPEEWLAAQQARVQSLLQVVRVLHEEGAPLLLGTDTPNPFVVQGFSIHRELTNLVGAGLSAYAALRCGTSEAARFVGEADEWGTIEVGKRADLLLLDANPLDDVGAVRRPQWVFVNGYAFSRSDLDGLLEQRRAVVSTPQLMDVDLEPADDSDRPERSGRLMERTAGALSGRLAFRHLRLANGSWLVEERNASNYGGNTLRTTRMWLAADFGLERAEYRLETAVGAETGSIARTSGPGYEVRVTEIDGHGRSEVIAEADLVPSERMAASVLPAMLAAQPSLSSTCPALSIENGAARVAPLEIVPLEPRTWQVRVQRPGQLTQQTYRLGPDGAFIGLDEMTWRGAREVRPVDGD
jgi:hypothetical protein